MTKLTDLQLVLLSTAAARSDASLLPPAASIAATEAKRIRRDIAALVGRELAADVIVTEKALSYRTEGDTLIGAAITDIGRAALGSEEPAASDRPGSASDAAALAAPPAPPASKTAQVLALLRRSDGADLDELVAATGWLPHTTRAALTGLRKKGHAIARSGETGASRYHLAA